MRLRDFSRSRSRSLEGRRGHPLGALDRALALRELIRAPTLKLDERVVGVDARGQKPEERRGTEGRGLARVQGRVQGRRKVEEGPDGAEDELDQHPGDDVELFDDVEEVEEKQRARRPEPGHGDEGEPRADRPGPVVGRGAHDADEADQVQDPDRALEHAGEGADVGGVPSEVGLDVGLRHRRRGRRRRRGSGTLEVHLDL